MGSSAMTTVVPFAELNGVLLVARPRRGLGSDSGMDQRVMTAPALGAADADACAASGQSGWALAGHAHDQDSEHQADGDHDGTCGHKLTTAVAGLANLPAGLTGGLDRLRLSLGWRSGPDARRRRRFVDLCSRRRVRPHRRQTAVHRWRVGADRTARLCGVRGPGFRPSSAWSSARSVQTALADATDNVVRHQAVDRLTLAEPLPQLGARNVTR